VADNVLGLVFEVSADPSKAAQAIQSFEAATGASLGKASGHFQQLQEKSIGVLQSLKDHFVITAGDVENFAHTILHAALSAAEFGEQLVHASEKTGIGVEELSALKFVASQTDVGFDTLQRGLALLAKGLSDITGPQAPAKKALDDLGLSATDAQGRLKPMSELLGEISGKFAKLPDGPERSALAIALFGRSGQALIPILDRGREGIERLEAQAHNLGVTITEQDARAAQNLARETRALHSELETLELAATKLLIPGLNVMAQALLGNQQAVQRLKDAASELGQRWLENQKAFYASLPPVQQFTSNLEKVEQLMSRPSVKQFATQLDSLRQALLAVSHAIHGSGLADDINEYLVPAVERASARINQLGVGTLENFSRAMGQNAANAIVFGANIAEAMERALKATLANIASEALVRAIFETAKGFAALARYDFHSASMHFESAAIFGLIGGVTAGLGAAIPGGGAGSFAGGRSGLFSQGSAAASTAARASAPPSPTSPAGLGGGGGTVVNVYVQGGMISADTLTSVINQISNAVQNQSVVLKATTALQPTTSRI